MQAWKPRGTECVFCFFRHNVLPHNSVRAISTSHSRSKNVKPKRRDTRSKSRPFDPKQEVTSPLHQRTKSLRAQIVRNNGFMDILNGALDQLHEIVGPAEGEARWLNFKKMIIDSCAGRSAKKELGLASKEKLQESFINLGIGRLIRVLKDEYGLHEFDVKFEERLKKHRSIADYRFPAEWYPAARTLQREVHLHVGPTNSGKTYHALKRLEKADNGFYAGPLRLLAHEVYTRFNAQGISCGLITGDEVRVPEGGAPRIYSNTVEMAPLGQEVEVAVIDEIQMIGDLHRGWAWTRALLGAPAKEIHLCGEERVVPLIRELVALTGDKLKIHQYKRLNPLMPMSKSLRGNFKSLQKGDCVVAFSRLGIHALKQEIEKSTGRRAAIVYGSLPAELRSQQADLFNDPNNDYDFLVASDAIGMGLNLSCKRIIFESVVKRTPSGFGRLSVSQIKQIGGRAGRYRSAAEAATKNNSTIPSTGENQNVGLVTCIEDSDLPYIQKCMNAEPEPIHAAGILPLDSMILNFHSQFPLQTQFNYVLERLWRVAQTHPRFFMCETQSSGVRETLDDVPGLSAADKLVFLSAPTTTSDPNNAETLKAFATCVAQHKSGSILDIPELHLEILDAPVSGDKIYLRSLESLHRSLVLYLWLSFRVGGIFTNRTLATHVKELVELKMDRALTEFSANSKLRKAASVRRQAALLKEAAACKEQETVFDPTQLAESQTKFVGVTT